MQKPTFSNTRITSENKYLRTIQRDFVDSQGREGNIITMESVHGKGGAFIFALTADNKIILNKEYKFGPDAYIYTFPSGFIEEDNVKHRILKELEEETGYSSESEVVYIGETIQNGYMGGGNNALFFAKNCYKKCDAQTHEGEEIQTQLVDLDALHTMILNGELLDPYTMSLYFLVKEKTGNFSNFDL